MPAGIGAYCLSCGEYVYVMGVCGSDGCVGVWSDDVDDGYGECLSDDAEVCCCCCAVCDDDKSYATVSELAVNSVYE